jgi:hypothetical protein
LTQKENDTLRFYLIPADQKGPIRKELSRLGIDAFSIYGDLEHLAKSLRAAYKIP